MLRGAPKPATRQALSNLPQLFAGLPAIGQNPTGIIKRRYTRSPWQPTLTQTLTQTLTKPLTRTLTWLSDCLVCLSNSGVSWGITGLAWNEFVHFNFGVLAWAEPPTPGLAVGDRPEPQVESDVIRVAFA